MFVGCSEISIYVIVKHLQHIGITWACSLPEADFLSFSVPGETEKCDHLTSLKSQNFLCQPW